MATINVKNIDLLLSEPNTILTTDTASGVTTITVKNIADFTTNQILILGNLGNDGTEIVKTHASTAPSGSTVTLASATLFPHSSSTQVTAIQYDQLEVSNASTITGSKTVIDTISINPTEDTTNYLDTVSYSGYFFARFKNSISSFFSVYSDPIPVSGYTIFSARNIIDDALSTINKRTSETLSDSFAFKQIDNCQMEVIRDLKRWSFLQSFDYHLGGISTGMWKLTLPDDIDDNNTTKSIYNFRVGNQSNLTWVDKEKWNEIITGVSYTTLQASISLVDTSITLTDSSNLTDSGVITIGANSYSYTANNRSTGVLTIPSSTTTNTAGEDVFQGATTGTPQYWTTYGGNLYFYPIMSAQYNGRDGMIDYYKKALPIQFDADQIVLPDPTLVSYYLQWKFMLKVNNGEETTGSESKFTLYEKRKAKMIQKESINRTFKLKPTLNKFNMGGDDPKSIRLGNFLQ